MNTANQPSRVVILSNSPIKIEELSDLNIELTCSYSKAIELIHSWYPCVFVIEKSINIPLKYLVKRSKALLPNIKLIVVGSELTEYERLYLQKYKVDDFLQTEHVTFPKLLDHITYVLEDNEVQTLIEYKGTPIAKRLFDIMVSGFAILLLSPIFLVVGLLIKLDSKGPIFYTSKRVGSRYKIFNFYKFRTMKTDADQMIDKMQHLNQYGAPASPQQNYFICEACLTTGNSCNKLLYKDGSEVCEHQYLNSKKQVSEKAFVKIQNDPRITKLGMFLRNSSIDELPQLFNILRGDMSIVGNRPLPLYEAEKLTTDRYVGRFLAPAGLTGLWQVSKRGQSNMSADERKMLDNEYAMNFSFWGDISIILRTVPALFQKENV